ncbi:MAG TPA: cell division protein SepF [Actinobacteria bacterium]|nr:cell division protein SepF [Actinomycetes bacterium]HEX21495.1 cell division protein SepF [Actinomycetota bacterium]
MREVWQKALAYFGLAEDEFYREEDDDFDEDSIYQETSSTVRKINRSPDLQRAERASSLRSVAPPGRVHIIEPRNYNDAQAIADKFKSKIPVIINLQECDQDLAKRIIDFVSGLTYGLNGNMRRISDKVFLVTPSNVTVSAEEKRRLRQRGFFFDKL